MKPTSSRHGKKSAAPIVITAVLVTYFIGFGLLYLYVPLPVWAKVLLILIPAACICLSIYVLAERIQEIRSGEEDDLSQY